MVFCVKIGTKRNIFFLVPSWAYLHATCAKFSGCHSTLSCPSPLEYSQLTSTKVSHPEDPCFNSVRESELDILIAKIRAGSSSEEVFQSLVHEKACNTVQVSHNLVAKLLCHFKDDWKSALGVFKWAESCPGYKPLPESYDMLVDILGRMKQMEKMRSLVDEMRQDHFVTLNTVAKVMRRFSGAGEWEAAARTFDELENALIYTLGRTGQVRNAVHVFEVEMPKVGVKANTSTYNSMISMFCCRAREQKDLDVLRDMENSSHCKPDAQSYYPLIKLYFKTGKTDVCLSKLLDDMVYRHHVSLDLASYTLLIHGFCRANKCESAYLLFEEMTSKEITPRYQTCRLLLDEIKQKNWYAAAERVEGFMKKMKSS
ncbi:hypothetical protein RJ640_000033 [Escallonia rubra]|uniref:Pentatricopeptide repeat-containing protein n=1 Tax=Escallonia rubra TaxID=112253 RepID=A0AA88RGM0_9ASTE|nr:hypothetical protein RJ640_000033 [Escallonia rubra]